MVLKFFKNFSSIDDSNYDAILAKMVLKYQSLDMKSHDNFDLYL